MTWVVASVLLCGGGCGGGDGPEDAAACSSAWQPLTAPQKFDLTSSLVYQGGTIYYSSFNANALLAQPTDGSAPTTLAPGAPGELWVEGDHLLFTGGDRGNQIYVLPFSGGVPQLIIDGGAGRTTPGIAMAHAFDASDFYWTEVPSAGVPVAASTVWHQARASGTAAAIGTLPFKDPEGLSFAGTAIALGSDSLVIGSAFGQSATLPVGGGDATSLSPPSTSANTNVQADLAGIDAVGAYWTVPGIGNQAASLVLSPADGSAVRSFWTAKPKTVEPVKLWPNPEGGWIVYSLQTFADGIHATITSIDAQGTATRLACSPGEGTNSWLQEGVAVAPDAIYVAAENLSADTWEIDRIAR